MKYQLISILVLAVGACALEAGQKGNPDPNRIAAAVVCQNVAIEVDDYGNASAFSIGKDNHLSPVDGTRQWLSINNTPVVEVNKANYTVVNSVSVDDSGCPTNTLASSTVVSNDGAVQIDYSHIVGDYGDGFGSWFMTATLTNLGEKQMRVCYYRYADIDLFGTPDNDMSSYTGSDPDTLLPAFRPMRDMDVPDQVFAHRTYVPRTAWAQLAYPALSDLIASFKGCQDLPRADRVLTGDYTGAFQYNLMIPAGESVSVQLEIGRIQ